MNILNINGKEWKYEYRKIKELIPLKKNPRKITKEELARLEKKIKDVGFNDVIKLDNEGNVLSGNQRLKVFKNLDVGDLEVMCCSPTWQMTEKEKQNVIINSNIQEGQFDYDLLDSYNLQDLKDWGLELEKITNNLLKENKNIDEVININKQQEIKEKINNVIKDVENLPEELQQVKLEPEKIEKINDIITPKTEMENIVICYKLEDKEKLFNFLKIDLKSNKKLFKYNDMKIYE